MFFYICWLFFVHRQTLSANSRSSSCLSIFNVNPVPLSSVSITPPVHDSIFGYPIQPCLTSPSILFIPSQNILCSSYRSEFFVSFWSNAFSKSTKPTHKSSIRLSGPQLFSLFIYDLYLSDWSCTLPGFLLFFCHWFCLIYSYPPVFAFWIIHWYLGLLKIATVNLFRRLSRRG